MIFTRTNAKLPLERACEIREIIEADCVRHLLSEHLGVDELFARALQSVTQQMLDKAYAVFLSEYMAKPGAAEAAQSGNFGKCDGPMEMRRHMRDRWLRFAAFAREINNVVCVNFLIDDAALSRCSFEVE